MASEELPFLPGCGFDARYLQPCNTGCNYDDGPDCAGCDTSKQWDSTITENCGCSGLSCAYKYKCMLRKPSMAMNNTENTERVTGCCTGLFNNETALNKCAPGWCPDTKLCHDAMISHCSSASGWQDGSNPRDYSTSSCARYVNNSKKELAADFLQKTLPAAFGSYRLITGEAIPPPIQSLNNYLSNTCKLFPGSCSSFLSGFCQALSREDMTQGQVYADVCGCYMPESQYPFSDKVPRPCDPICNLPNAIPFATPGSDSEERCTDTVCILDNISIDVKNSSGGKIALNQLCGNSRGKDSKFSQCYFDNVTVDGVNAMLTSGDTIQQGCDICFSGGTAENPTEVSCGVPPTPPPPPPPPTPPTPPSPPNVGGGWIEKIAIFGGIGLVVIILFALVLWFLFR
nr:transmembrane domain containing protein [Marseillevirus futianmevirus]